MEKLELHGSQHDSSIFFGESIDNLSQFIPPTRTVIVTDRSIHPMVKHRLPDVPVFEVIPGEYSKSLRVATLFYRWLQDIGADRHTFIVGVGGGTICDLAGFVASTYMRGVGLGFVPTTLLAQVDASVGGKNSLNLYGFKNVVGTFYQPEFVLLDYSLLSTLPPVEVTGGLAEMIKHSVVADADRFTYFQEHAAELLRMELSHVAELVEWSVRLKSRYVVEDEFDRGLRRKLNFGHTWGHAVEGVTGIHHGQAVAIGMVFAAKLAQDKGYCEEGLVSALESILQQYHLPTRAQVLPWVVYNAMLKDKKRDADSVHFVLPRRIGEVEIERVSFEELKSFIERTQLSD